MAHVTAEESGIFSRHIDAVERTVSVKNTFLFVRPTEYDSTVLIESGFPTKNMDIHDKSSNWGPMAGMVPCDPYFSKKMEGSGPNPDIHPHDHGQAFPIELALESPVLLKMLNRGKIKKAAGRWAVNGQKVTAAAAPTPGIGFYDGSGPKATITFCIREKKVYWVKWSTAQKTSGILIPVWVWAYQVPGGRKKPVTGDYDIWMVAPHASHYEAHNQSRLTEDPHGKSTWSEFTEGLAKELNDSCARLAPNTCKVFNHGAEAQNYAFTQALDPRLAMFTPAGTSRMVSIWEMGRILADMETMGYLAIYNKRYGELDARLMGRTTIPEIARLEKTEKMGAPSNNPFTYSKRKAARESAHEQRSRLLQMLANRLALRRKFREALADLRVWNEVEHPRTPGGIARPRFVQVGEEVIPEHGTEEWAGRQGRRFAQANWKLLRAAVRHGYESSRITRLWDEIQQSAKGIGGDLTCLTLEDFPPNIRRLHRVAQGLLGKMRATAVQATKGAGESDEQMIAKFWLDNREDILEVIDEFKRAAPEG